MWHTGVHRCLRGNHNDRTPTPQSGNLIFATLLRSRAVKRVVEWLEAHEDEGPRGVRRRLLGTSVRLTRRMAGDLHEMVDACRERLGVQTPLELYVYASPSFNAACVKPEAGRLFILFSSSLIESFKGNELGFVIGHELGHHLYDHHDVPIGYLLRGREPAPPSLALQLFAWSRYAEISADRAGALCAGDLEAEARSLFMLSSGLTGATIEFRLDDFLTQVGEMQLETDDPGVGAPREDWFSTHPFSPLRVKALQLFSESEFVTEGGGSGAELEAQIQSLMALMELMEPSYLEEHSEAAEAMRRLLFASAIAVAHAAGGVSDKEVEIFERFFGTGAFSERLDLDRIVSELDERIADARSRASHPKHIQVVRDLCTVARADGSVDEGERAVIERIAKALDVPMWLVDQTLNAEVELD